MYRSLDFFLIRQVLILTKKLLFLVLTSLHIRIYNTKSEFSQVMPSFWFLFRLRSWRARFTTDIRSLGKIKIVLIEWCKIFGSWILFLEFILVNDLINGYLSNFYKRSRCNFSIQYQFIIQLPGDENMHLK